VPIFLVILFIALPIAELYLIIQLGGAIGVLPTIGILILDSFLGVALLRSQGRNVWARFNQTMAEGRLPAREVFDGAMVILGGALLLTPGFITDVFGLILLIPPTRDLVRGAAAWLARRRTRPVSWVFGAPGASRGPRPSPRRGYDVEGTATEVNPEAPELGERRPGDGER